MIIYTKRLPKGVDGITIFPFIILRDRVYNPDRLKRLIRHEKIHFRQQIECLIIPFYIIYLINYVINLVKYRGEHYMAYYMIRFEVEAYNKQYDKHYLEYRKLYSWL